MHSIRFPDSQISNMLRHLSDEFPNEGCGLLVGKGNEIAEVIPLKNVSLTPSNHYEIDPVALSRHLPAIERRGLSLIGFYHSHPMGVAIPSETDIREATYPNTAYIIVGLKHTEPEIAAWKMNYGTVKRIPLIMSAETSSGLIAQSAFSKPQVFALFISGVFAFLILLVLSLMLLPPPPIIP